MRLAMLTHNIRGMGGSYMRSWSLARNMAIRGHEVTLVAGRSRPGIRVRRSTDGRLQVLEVPDAAPLSIRHGGLSPVEVVGRSLVLMAESFDLVYGFDHRPSVSVPAGLSRFARGIPYIADWADLWGPGGIAGLRQGPLGWVLGRLDGWWEARTRQSADALTVASAALMQAARRLGQSPERILKLRPGANVDLVRPLRKDRMRARFSLPQEARIAVHIGFAPYDQDLLADTVIALCRLDPRSHWILTGGGYSAVMRHVERSGLGGRVLGLGFVSYADLAEVLACGDVMVLPYRDRMINRGRFPNKVGDYTAAGRPVVTNPTGELGRIVQEELLGYVAEESGVAMAEGIAKLFDDPRLMDEMGRRARLYAETKMSWALRAEELEAFFQRLTGSVGFTR